MGTMCERVGIVSPSRCTQRCMRYTTIPGSRLRSNSNRRRTGRGPSSAFHVPRNCLEDHRGAHGGRKRGKKNLKDARGGSGNCDDSYRAGCRCQGVVSRSRAVRRRHARLNGADLYVARITKIGAGSAKPCWRCIVWCQWAGVKRVFFWDSELGKFEMVKVNGVEVQHYKTHSDLRLQSSLKVCLWSRGSSFDSNSKNAFVSRNGKIDREGTLNVLYNACFI
jgi:hypothetical protein